MAVFIRYWFLLVGPPGAPPVQKVFITTSGFPVPLDDVFFFSLSIHSARRWSVASSDSSGPFKTASRQSVGFRVFTEQGEQAARRPDDEAKTGRAGAFQQVRGRDENARADHGADD